MSDHTTMDDLLNGFWPVENMDDPFNTTVQEVSEDLSLPAESTEKTSQQNCEPESPAADDPAEEKSADTQPENEVSEPESAQPKNLFAQKPVFSYQSIREEINDPTITFDALRQLKARDFPELDSAASVSWKVRYGTVTKTVTNPAKISIASLKSEIEFSKAFLDGLKKSSDKAPQCKVEPDVKGRTKGIALYKGLYATREDAEEADKPISIFPARDGRVYEMRKLPFGVFIAPKDNIEELSRTEAGFQPALPLLPYEQFSQIVAFFRSLAAREHPVEAMVDVYWDSMEEKYLIAVPPQKVSGARVFPQGSSQLDPERYWHTMQIHSHNVMPAFFSDIDDKSEQATRIYLVIDRLRDVAPQVRARISCGGTFVNIRPEQVVETLPGWFPRHWLRAVHAKGGRTI